MSRVNCRACVDAVAHGAAMNCPGSAGATFRCDEHGTQVGPGGTALCPLAISYPALDPEFAGWIERFLAALYGVRLANDPQDVPPTGGAAAKP